MATSTVHFRAGQPVISVQPVLYSTFFPYQAAVCSCQQDFSIVFSKEDAEIFFDACENPPAPSSSMHEMMKDVAEWLK